MAALRIEILTKWATKEMFSVTFDPKTRVHTNAVLPASIRKTINTIKG